MNYFKEDVKHGNIMKVIGIVLILLSCIEFGVGAAAYGSLANVQLGAWWAGLCTFYAGIAGLLSMDKNTVIANCVFSSIGFVIALAGSIVDGIAHAVFAGEKACVSSSGQIYGDQGQYNNLASCAFAFYFDAQSKGGIDSLQSAAASVRDIVVQYYNDYYYNVNHNYDTNYDHNYYYNSNYHPYYYYNQNNNYNDQNNYYSSNSYYSNNNYNDQNYNNYNNYYYSNNNNNYNYYYNHPYQTYYYNHHNNQNNYNNYYYYNSNFRFDSSIDCICTDNALCYSYTLASLNNCGEILTTYTNLLSGSTTVLSLLVVLSFANIIVTCISCCGPPLKTGSNAATGVEVVIRPFASEDKQTSFGSQQTPVRYAPMDDQHIFNSSASNPSYNFAYDINQA